uniref:Amine oxidase domain-containing protein n=1 Tax=Oncorhynchus mykiss TaxID=8022 RepID=A0A8K9V078_ONCMY
MDIQRLVPKPILRCLGCVLRVVVLLEGEGPPQSEVLNALEQVFIKDLSVLCSVHLSLDPDLSPTHTCLYKVPQLTMHVRAKTKQFSIQAVTQQNVEKVKGYEYFSKCTDEARSPLYEMYALQLGHYIVLERALFQLSGSWQTLSWTAIPLEPCCVTDQYTVSTGLWRKRATLIQPECCARGGQCFTADHVIVTIPLGFQIENVAAMFKQALPKSKADDRFWSRDWVRIQLVWDAGGDEEVYQHSQSEGGAWRDIWYKICGFDTVARHPTILCSWITGREAQHMESLDEKMLGQVCMRCVSRLSITQTLTCAPIIGCVGERCGHHISSLRYLTFLFNLSPCR